MHLLIDNLVEKIADWIVCQPKGQLRIIQQNIFGEKFSTDLCRQLELLLSLRSVSAWVFKISDKQNSKKWMDLKMQTFEKDSRNELEVYLAGKSLNNMNGLKTMEINH